MGGISTRVIPIQRPWIQTSQVSRRKRRTRRVGSISRQLSLGAYPTGIDGWTRPPHIHFDAKAQTDRVITQMYFAGEPLNDKDELLLRIRRKEAVIAKLLPATPNLEPGSLIAAWDIVLTQG